MAVKVAVTNNLVAVKGHQVAVVLGWSGSEGLPGSGNPGQLSIVLELELSVDVSELNLCFGAGGGAGAVIRQFSSVAYIIIIKFYLL